jgi:hypothetical protein
VVTTGGLTRLTLTCTGDACIQYCEEGSLRTGLDYGLLTDVPAAPGASASGVSSAGRTGLGYALSLAHDVATAMLHLHSENMLHGDLKVRPACGRRRRLSIEIGGFPLPCKYTLDMHD